MSNTNCGGDRVQSYLSSRNDRSMIRLCALLWILNVQEDHLTRCKQALLRRRTQMAPELVNSSPSKEAKQVVEL